MRAMLFKPFVQLPPASVAYLCKASIAPLPMPYMPVPGSCYESFWVMAASALPSLTDFV